MALGLASLIYILIEGLPEVVLSQNMINGIDSFPLLAIPFFILVGHFIVNYFFPTDCLIPT